LGAGEFATYDGKKMTDGLGELRSGFQLPLLRDNAIDLPRLDIAQAELDLERARLGVFEKQLKFIKMASKQYWAWVAAAKKQELAKDLLLLAQKRNDDLSQSVALGQSPRILLTENQTSLLKRQAKLVEAQQKQQQTAWELSLFLLRNSEGRPQLPQISAPGQFPFLPSLDVKRLISLLATALQSRPEPLDLELQLEQNRLARLWAENQNLPQLDLNFGISKDLGGNDKTREPLELEAGLGFEWPIQFRKARGLLQTLEAEKQQLEWELRFSREEIEVEIQNLVTVLQAAQQRLELVRQQVKVALELEMAERDRFALGATTLLVLNLREQARGEAMNEEIEALEVWFKSWAEYITALGLLQESALPLP
jgi:outer membrane protein TolC